MLQKALLLLLLALGLVSMAEETYSNFPNEFRRLHTDDEGQPISELIEEAEREEHPMLRASRVQDARLQLLKDFNHVLPFKFGGNTNTIYKLVPDTGLNEVALITSNCKNCTGVASSKWVPPTSTGMKKNITGTVDHLTYFYKLHAFDTKVNGTFYKLSACIEHSPNPSICLMNFQLLGIEKAAPFYTANGDGYLGLGLGKSIDGTNDFNFLAQLKQHGLIDKKIFSVYTQMSNSTDNPSQIRFGGVNDNLWQGNPMVWLDTVAEDSWKV